MARYAAATHAMQQDAEAKLERRLELETLQAHPLRVAMQWGKLTLTAGRAHVTDRNLTQVVNSGDEADDEADEDEADEDEEDDDEEEDDEEDEEDDDEDEENDDDEADEEGSKSKYLDDLCSEDEGAEEEQKRQRSSTDKPPRPRKRARAAAPVAPRLITDFFKSGGQADH